MYEELKQAVQAAAKKLFDADIEPVLTRPDEKFGDYATNAALQLAKKAAASPQQIARQLIEELQSYPGIKEATVAGPGFINFRLTNQALAKAAFTAIDLPKPLTGEVIVTEYSDPNPFKILHAGHLYTSVVGDSISNLLETMGAIVHRINFGGDVGLHVAKSMWAINQELGGWDIGKMRNLMEADDQDLRAGWLSQRYIEGNNAYDENEFAKSEIIELNKEIYRVQEQQDKDSPLAQVYWLGREWSYEYFKYFYNALGIKPFEEYVPESKTVRVGQKYSENHQADLGYG